MEGALKPPPGVNDLGFFDFVNNGSTKEFKTQLMFYDDDSFEFKKRPFKDSCLVEEKDENIVRAWRHFFGTEKRFTGYKTIKTGNVVLACNRDFILDAFEEVPETTNPSDGGKPKKDDASIRLWTRQIAESQRYKVITKPLNMLLWNKITIFLGCGLLFEMLIWFISRARG
jgi:hypothetical protein